jgi:hypothetical protein
VKKRSISAIAAVVALTLAGCGGSSNHSANPGGTGTTSTANSKALFIAQLNSLCGKADSAFAAAHNASGQEAVVSHYVALFAALKAPPALKSLYSQYVSVLQKELVDLKKGDSKGLFKLAHDQAKPLVKKIGAEGCVTSS